MAIRPALRNILKVVGDLSHYNVNTNVVDTEVSNAVVVFLLRKYMNVLTN